MEKPQLHSQWGLQEAITEHWTATRTELTELTLRLELISDSYTSSLSSLSSSSSLASAPSPSSLEPPRTTRAASRQRLEAEEAQRLEAEEDKRPVYRIQVVQGTTVLEEIDTTFLRQSNSQVRFERPTRATVLYPGPEEPARDNTTRGGGRVPAGSKTQAASQSSQNGPNGLQKKRRRFLMLCFVKPGDLKTVLQKFSRSGIRCKIREAKTGAGEASLARTSSVVSAGSQGSQEGHRPGLTRALSSQPMRAATSWFIPTAMPLKRPHSENPPDAERSDRMKRRQTSIAHDAHSPSLLRRESSQDDTLASPWTPAIKCTGGRPQSQTPRLTRLSSGPPHHRFRDFPMQANANSPANEEVDEPPPRRELPQSITRHISLPSSQAEGTNSRSASGGSRRIAVAVAEMEVQTEEPFVEPEDALFAGMDLFHELLALKDKMIKECLNMTLLLGGRANGASDEAEARLAARYAIEFQSRSVEIFAQHANSYLA